EQREQGDRAEHRVEQHAPHHGARTALQRARERGHALSPHEARGGKRAVFLPGALFDEVDGLYGDRRECDVPALIEGLKVHGNTKESRRAEGFATRLELLERPAEGLLALIETGDQLKARSLRRTL